MIVIKTGKPLRKVFLKTGEEVVARDGEFQETDFGVLESVSTAEVFDRETLENMIEERLSEARAEWQAEAAAMSQAAQEKGRAEGRAEAEAKLAARAKVFEDLIASLSAGREELMRKAESTVVDLALAIARRFVDVAADAGSDVIKQSIKSAVRLVTEKDKLVLRVNPDDLEEVRRHQDDIIFIGDGIGKLDVRPDKQVRRGGCVMETDAGNIDARLDTRMAEIEKSLRQVFHTAESEPEGNEDAVANPGND